MDIIWFVCEHKYTYAIKKCRNPYIRVHNCNWLRDDHTSSLDTSDAHHIFGVLSTLSSTSRLVSGSPSKLENPKSLVLT